MPSLPSEPRPPSIVTNRPSLAPVTVLLLNAICIPSEDRFLARVGLSPTTYQRGFGQDLDSSVKYRVVQLIASVRTVMRGGLRRISHLFLPSNSVRPTAC
ncbi:hypothetical protein VTJ49DRAFT_104 [Mycothermus thermophilus]|uniref:HTH araC/xylS-type domain-containing protein n=1 Tax=Humicola insolens TaxID=85995 RepID=A0ABR3VR83_HUMIN